MDTYQIIDTYRKKLLSIIPITSTRSGEYAALGRHLTENLQVASGLGLPCKFVYCGAKGGSSWTIFQAISFLRHLRGALMYRSTKGDLQISSTNPYFVRKN